VAFAVFQANAKSILSETSGFIAEAGFTHSLTPSRNCGYACTYCYVPTMRFQGGLQPEDWRRWGQFTTFKTNAAELLERAVRPDRTIYCSPTVDPYQPAEADEQMMPRILDVLIARPPRAFVIQTRGPLILRDLDRLRSLAARRRLRVSFSLTTDRDDIRRAYEPLCASVSERLEAMARLTAAGIPTHATLAPLLPCNPERLMDLALAVTNRDPIGDPFHVRSVKRHGATTRDAALRICEQLDHAEWLDPAFQSGIVGRLKARAAAAGRSFEAGPRGFHKLVEN
jgi:DNA repair photolyase